jgi:hypothetical protein
MTEKKLLIATGTVALLTNFGAQAFQNEPNGFRNIPWGTPIESVQAEMAKVEGAKEGASDLFYKRRGDEMKIGEATLSDLAYNFYKGRFAGVLIDTKGITNEQSLIRAFSAQFGPGKQANRYLNDFLWFGAVAEAYVSCKPITHDCTAFIRSTRIAAQERADHEAAARGAKKDF